MAASVQLRYSVPPVKHIHNLSLWTRQKVIDLRLWLDAAGLQNCRKTFSPRVMWRTLPDPVCICLRAQVSQSRVSTSINATTVGRVWGSNGGSYEEFCADGGDTSDFRRSIRRYIPRDRTLHYHNSLFLVIYFATLSVIRVIWRQMVRRRMNWNGLRRKRSQPNRSTIPAVTWRDGGVPRTPDMIADGYAKIRTECLPSTCLEHCFGRSCSSCGFFADIWKDSLDGGSTRRKPSTYTVHLRRNTCMSPVEAALLRRSWVQISGNRFSTIFSERIWHLRAISQYSDSHVSSYWGAGFVLRPSVLTDANACNCSTLHGLSVIFI
jgi:hypothetical protein